MNLFGTVLRGLGTAIGFHEARHQVISENLANAETPGFRARRLEFDQELQRVFQGDDLSGVDPSSLSEIDRTAPIKADRNSVDLDTEMARMSENSLRTVALSRMLARKYAGLKTAIMGTR